MGGPSAAWVLRHTWVGPFREDRRQAPSSPFQPPARGHRGASSVCPGLAGCSPAPRCLPAWCPARCSPRRGRDPAKNIGLLSLPHAGRAAPLSAIRLLPFTVIQTVPLSPGCSLHPRTGGTGCWVLSSSQSRARGGCTALPSFPPAPLRLQPCFTSI